MGKQDIFDFLIQKKEKLCVLATVGGDNAPECAVVGYAAKEDGTICINTNTHTRKASNLRKNQHVALAIGWNFNDRNVQYEGKAEIVEREDPDFSEWEEFFFGVNPSAEIFKSPDTVFIKITPTWVRMTDLTKTPPAVDEVSL